MGWAVSRCRFLRALPCYEQKHGFSKSLAPTATHGEGGTGKGLLDGDKRSPILVLMFYFINFIIKKILQPNVGSTSL